MAKPSRSWLALDTISTMNAKEVSSLNIVSATKVAVILLALDVTRAMNDVRRSDLRDHLDGSLPLICVDVI